MTDQLYPTLVADSSLDTHVPDNQDTLLTQLTSEVDKYLQEAAESVKGMLTTLTGGTWLQIQ